MIQTLQTGTYKKSTEHRAQSTEHKKLKTKNSLGSGFWVPGSFLKGFTLLELIVVIFIISITTALVMPSFWNFGESSLKAEAKNIGSVLSFVYDEAVGKKGLYLFKIDIDEGAWGFEGKKESRNFRLKRDVKIKGVLIPSLGEISKGQIIIKFGPLGPEEPLILHLMKDESEYTVIFNHLNGRSKILEGYRYKL